MDSEQLKALKRLAKKHNYGGSPEHAKQVMRLSMSIYKELARLNLLHKSKEGKALLKCAALLHNTGLPDEPHNKAAFDMLRLEIPEALADMLPAPEELSTILYCVLWHRGRNFEARGNIKIEDPPRVSRLAAILRVADALDRSFEQIVDDVSLSLSKGGWLFSVSSTLPTEAELARADEKADLMRQAFDIEKIDFVAESF
jgi:exopolyphosphatase/guanosine-5'-triphosphate,3'-diphosphate pyrophosphatase